MRSNPSEGVARRTLTRRAARIDLSREERDRWEAALVSTLRNALYLACQAMRRAKDRNA